MTLVGLIANRYTGHSHESHTLKTKHIESGNGFSSEQTTVISKCICNVHIFEQTTVTSKCICYVHIFGQEHDNQTKFSNCQIQIHLNPASDHKVYERTANNSGPLTQVAICHRLIWTSKRNSKTNYIVHQHAGMLHVEIFSGVCTNNRCILVLLFQQLQVIKSFFSFLNTLHLVKESVCSNIIYLC